MIDSAIYYEKQEKNLGEEFLNEIEQGLEKIQQFPSLWQLMDKRYRRYLLQKFTFGIVYRIDKEKIFILAIAHFHRKPNYWKIRKKP